MRHWAIFSISSSDVTDLCYVIVLLHSLCLSPLTLIISGLSLSFYRITVHSGPGGTD